MVKINFPSTPILQEPNNTFGEFGNHKFLFQYHQCLYKEGKEGADLREVIGQLETFLESAGLFLGHLAM